jgi:hypothetical protein
MGLTRRVLVAALIALGPLTAAGFLFLVLSSSGDVSIGAAFYLGVALVVTPFCLFGPRLLLPLRSTLTLYLCRSAQGASGNCAFGG